LRRALRRLNRPGSCSGPQSRARQHRLSNIGCFVWKAVCFSPGVITVNPHFKISDAPTFHAIIALSHATSSLRSPLSDTRSEGRDAWFVARATANPPKTRNQIMCRYCYAGRVIVLFSYRSWVYLTQSGIKGIVKGRIDDLISQIHVDNCMESIKIPCCQSVSKEAEIWYRVLCICHTWASCDLALNAGHYVRSKKDCSYRQLKAIHSNSDTDILRIKLSEDCASFPIHKILYHLIFSFWQYQKIAHGIIIRESR
jgi:hypothetical protein